MPRISQASVEAVKAAADMVAVVQGRTQLRKSGPRYLGRCPFHEEKTPSFSVNPTDKLFYCFGCGKGGDVVSFVRETENLDFAAAVEWLAERFNVPLEYEESSPQADAERRRRERLTALLEQATAFYERYLWDSGAGAPAREYLASRGLGEEVCREFRLGLSPLGSTLARKAQEKGFSPAELTAAGLVNRRGNDYFAGRLMFPLADARGRVVGFSARKLRQDDPLKGKYVNSPEAELFHKSSILYGLHLGRAAIAKQDRAVVVEGNTDAIALRQTGLEPVVAALGTALTERQLRELGRLTRQLYLCFDADVAGSAATLRGMELAVQMGFTVRVVALEPGLDPAEAADGFAARLDGAASYALHRTKLEIDSAPSPEEALRSVQALLRGFDQNLEWVEAIQYASERLDLPDDVVRSSPGFVVRGELKVKPLRASIEKIERDALAGVIAHPKLVGALAELGPEHFDVELHRRLRAHLVEGEEPDAELVALLAELDARAQSEGIDEATAEQLLLRLRERQLKRELSTAAEERLPDLLAALDRVRTAFSQLA